MGFPGCEGICLKARLSFLPRGVQGRPGPGQREVQSPARLCLSPHHLARDLCQPEGGASECPLLSFFPGCPPQPRWPPVFAPELCVWKSRCILRKGRKLLPGPQGPCAGPLLWGCLGQSGLRMPSSGGLAVVEGISDDHACLQPPFPGPCGVFWGQSFQLPPRGLSDLPGQLFQPLTCM